MRKSMKKLIALTLACLLLATLFVGCGKKDDGGSYGGDKVGHIPLIRTYAENVLETLHWMQKHGTPVMDRVSQGAGALWQRTHQVDAPAGTGLIEPLLKAANKEGVKIITGMRAQELIYRNGEVVGVKASDKVGNSYEFKSKYGVILATGGYSQNKEMRQKSSPVLTPDMVSTNQPGATGDGIVMARRSVPISPA